MWNLNQPFRKKTQAPDHRVYAHNLERMIEFLEIRRTVAKLHSALQGGKLKSVAVTSLARGEGKTTVVAALAFSLSRHYGQKVLIIDTTTFHRNEAVKIETLLGVSEKTSRPVASRLFTGIDFLRLSERENRVFTSRDNHELDLVLGEENSKYDLILMDTTAFETKNRQNYDAQMVAACADGVVFVKSDLDLAGDVQTQLLEDLKTARLNILGVLSNSGAPS